MHEPEKVFLRGIRDSAIYKKDHEFLIYEVLKCTDESRRKENMDPKCVDKD